MSKQILLVEDEDILAMLLTSELEEHGLSVQRASNGYEGIELLEKQSFDGIVTDLFMAAMDGLEFLERIEVAKLSIPTAVVTGSNTRQVNEKLSELGVTNIFRKPLDEDDLHRLITLLKSD